MIRALRVIRWASIGLLVLIAVGITVYRLRPTDRSATAATQQTVAPGFDATIGGPFHLTDTKGRPVNDAGFRGRWMLVFFGYTNCPTDCPLTLQKMSAALEKLGPLADKVVPLFITVDPARDTPARMASYLGNFDPRIVGLTGDDKQIAEAAQAYKVFYSPAQHEASGVDLVSHSNLLYLMTPAGTFDAPFSADDDAEKLAVALRAKLAAKS